LGFEQNIAAKVFSCLATILLRSVLSRLHITENMNIHLTPLKNIKSERRMHFTDATTSMFGHVKAYFLTIFFCFINCEVFGFCPFVNSLLKAGKLSGFHLLHSVLFLKL